MGWGDYDTIFPPKAVEDPELVRVAVALEKIAAGDNDRTEAYEYHLRMRRQAAERHEVAVEGALCDDQPKRRRLVDVLRAPYWCRQLAGAFALAFCASSGGVVSLHYVFGIHL